MISFARTFLAIVVCASANLGAAAASTPVPETAHEAETTAPALVSAPPSAPASASGLKNGTSYTVVSSTTRHEPAAVCAFDAHGAPKLGVYLVEQRAYEAWQDGVFVKSWVQTVKTFQTCYEKK